MALKIARIVDLCGKSSGLADFENTVDRGSVAIFDADPALCLSYVGILGPKRNFDHRSFFSFGRYVNEFIQIIYFFERSSLKLRCETVLYSHQACCLLYYLGKITLLFSDVVVVSDLNKNFGESTDLVKKWH